MASKIEIPKELSDQILKLVEDARSGGKIRKGTNEATKSVERNEAKFVVIAADVNPPEIIQHIPMLCDEKKIPCAFVPAKADLGAAAGLPVGTSAIAIVSAGESAKKMSQIVEQLEVLSGKKAVPAKTEAKAETPAAKPKAPKKAKEEKTEEKKEVAVAVTG
ncbi:MAG: 50S ribosomal protein L7ae [DPANN group archaeon]|nr:50S ribosomal protein L7ae [DPANN group archaeon]